MIHGYDHPQELLRQSEERFSLFFRKSPVATSITAIESGRYLAVNEAWTRMLGYEAEDIMGQTSFELKVWENMNERVELVRQLNANGSVHELPATLRTRAGMLLDVLMSAETIELHDGRYLLMLIQDVTQSRRAEEALKKSEALYRILTENSTDFISCLTPEGTWTFASPACRMLIGYESAELEGRSFFDFIHEEDAGSIRKVFASLSAEWTTSVVSFRFRHKEGFYIWFESTCRCIWNVHSDTPVEIQTSMREITERKYADEALRRSLSLIQATLESTADGILAVDSIGQITGYNQQFVKMWNIPKHMIQARDDMQIISQIVTQLKNPDEFIAKVDHLYRNPELDSYDVIEFTNGKIFERYSRPQRVAGEPVGRVWSFRDITERRSLERQLIQSQKLESLGTLAGGIAHDFNNLLALILGSAELLVMQTKNDPKLQKYVDRIIDASERGKSISRQLLMFSKPMQAELASLRLSDVVGELRTMLSHFLPKSISIAFVAATEDDRIVADAGQIQQALLNLAINAGDAMPEGGELTIRLENADPAELHARFGASEATPFVALSVSDTGVGIAEPLQAKVFDPFFTTKPHGKGTGLGLSIIHGIVKSHKGYVGLQSTVGCGTTFALYFPLESAQPDGLPSGR